MKLVKTVLLAALAVTAIVGLGAASAAAESTRLCATDAEPCTEGVTSLHLVGSSKLLTTFLTAECQTLFSGTSNGELGSHPPLQGSFTFTNCGSCEAQQIEEEKPGEVERQGHELGWWHYHYVILWRCGASLHCVWGFWIWLHFLGPLLSSNKNGEFKVSEEEVKKLPGGLLCPKTTKLDQTLEPLTPLYIKS